MSRDGDYPGRKNNTWGDSNHRSGGYRDRPGGSRDWPGGSRDRPGGSRDRPGGSGDWPGRSRDRTGGSGDWPGGSRDQPAGFRGRPRDVPPGPPKLITFQYLPPEENNPNASRAKMVFLGNLHPDMKQCNVYDLCTSTKSPPLHVTMRTRTHSYGHKLHSAYVYVRSEKDVENLVQSLDKLKINGYRMIVCPIEKMIEEGRALSNQNRE